MKKNVLMKSALAVAITATTATAIADVTLYGRFRAGLVSTDDGTDSQVSLENRSSRFGIKANHKISDGLTAFGRYEFRVELDEGALRGRATDSAQRLSYVGVSGGFGQFSIGTRWSPMYNFVTTNVDPYQLLGGTWQPVGYISTFRVNDSLHYSNNFGPVSFGALLQFDESQPNDDIDRIEVGGSASFGPVNLGLAYMDDVDDNQTVGVFVGGNFGPAKLGVAYYSQDNGDNGGIDQEAVMGRIGFGFGSGMSLDISIGQDMPDASGAAEASMVAAEFGMKLSKSFRWFAAVQSTDFDTAGVDDEVKAGVGMRLEF